MTPAEEATSPQISRGGSDFGRLAAIAALVLVVVAIIYLLLFSGGGGNKYRLVMEGGGQLVKGNQVLIGGVPVGGVDDVKLLDDGQAEVTITVDRELHQGTEAITRATSLSGIANRYISLQPGPDNAPELEENGVISAVDTTSPVDLDQLFNTLREPERKGLQDIIQGSATVYAGRGPEANETYRYLSSSLTAADRLFRAVNRDQRVLTDFLVNGSRVVTALAERRDDISGLVSNSNEALGAIASQNRAFDRALRALPPALRQANTTFFNLRPALDDLDPLVETSKTATKNLAPFLRQFRKVLGKSVPVFHDLRLAVNLRGKNNDLTDASARFVPIHNAASRSVPANVQALSDSEPTVKFLRPYSPELMSGIQGLAQITGYYDADGHYARAEPAGLGLFRLDALNELDPIPLSEIFMDYGPFNAAVNKNAGVFRRCPGGATQANLPSNPFLDGGGLATPAPPGDCTVTDVPLGP